MFSSYAFMLPFKAHLLRAPWSIFRLHVAKLKRGDECQRQVLFLAVQTRLALSFGICPQQENESLVYSAPGTMSGAGEGGRRIRGRMPLYLLLKSPPHLMEGPVQGAGGHEATCPFTFF